MDGHECSEVRLCELDSTHRLDAEFYSKEYIYETHQLLKRDYFTLQSHYKVTDGEHGSVKYLNNGVAYLTAENIKNGFVDLSKIRYVSEEVNKRNARASIKEGDILISIKGTLGSIAVATSDLLPCNMNRDVAVMKPLYPSTNSNYFTALFLMSKYGALQSQRGGSGGVQQMITLGRLKEFIIPEFSDSLYKSLKEAYDLFLSLRKKSKIEFTNTESCLLNALNINMSVFADNSIVIKTLADSFGSSGRLDAEYYQKRYQKLITALKATETIATKCKIYDKTYIPNDNQKYKYIELANIGKNGEIDDVNPTLGSELPTRARRIVHKNQILVSSIEGSLENCALITDEYDNALCSTGFYVIDSDEYNSETLLILLKSKPIQSLLKRGCSGTILTNISKDEFLNIPLPSIEKSVQEKIKSGVNKSFKLREESKLLLEYAKQAVEMAIEQNENTAITWLNGKIAKLAKGGQSFHNETFRLTQRTMPELFDYSRIITASQE